MHAGAHGHLHMHVHADNSAVGCTRGKSGSFDVQMMSKGHHMDIMRPTFDVRTVFQIDVQKSKTPIWTKLLLWPRPEAKLVQIGLVSKWSILVNFE